MAAGADDVWRGLVAYLGAAGRSRRGRWVAARLGCVPGTRSGPPGEIGSTIPGFVVTRSIAPAVLALMGEHRFARYALIFRITETPAGPTRLSAETRAEFPGTKGRIYRGLVIGSRGHVVAVHSILRSVRRAAERS